MNLLKGDFISTRLEAPGLQMASAGRPMQATTTKAVQGLGPEGPLQQQLLQGGQIAIPTGLAAARRPAP